MFSQITVTGNAPDNGKYGNLSAKDVLINRQLKDRRARFDSAEYQMQQARQIRAAAAAEPTPKISPVKSDAVAEGECKCCPGAVHKRASCD